MSIKNERGIEDVTRELTASFARWDHLYTYGGSDPFHSDGDNLYLVRNHIISGKLELERLIQQEQEQPTLFTTPFPDIYYRETPPVVPSKYMARADEIRAHAKEQLALYEQDPNFCFIRDHHADVFPKGETKATKAAGISPYITTLTRYRKVVEEDNLVYMRSYFYDPYEKKALGWAQLAAKMKAYLEADHSQDDLSSVPDNTYDEDYDVCGHPSDLTAEECIPSTPQTKETHSLDELLSSAVQKTSKPDFKDMPSKDEQMALF